MTEKLTLRSALDIPVSEVTTSEEQFQNTTLRPVLKLQNDLYVALFEAAALRQNADFGNLSKEKKDLFITQSLQKDTAFKNMCLGITVGMFTREELKIYLSARKSYNRRIIKMLTERLQKQVE